MVFSRIKLNFTWLNLLDSSRGELIAARNPGQSITLLGSFEVGSLENLWVQKMWSLRTICFVEKLIIIKDRNLLVINHRRYHLYLNA